MPDVTYNLRPHEIAPGGIGGEAEFKWLYITVTYHGDFELNVTPVVDGEEITDETVMLTKPAPAEGERTHRFEVALYRDVDHTGTAESRRGLRGTWFTVKLDGHRASLGSRFSVDGITVVAERIQENHPEITFQPLSLVETGLSHPVEFFMGAKGGNAVYRLLDGHNDAGADLPLRVHTMDASPAGEGGEAIFRNVYIGLSRNNSADVTLDLTVIVDEVPHETIPVTISGTTDPIADVHEVSLYRHWPEHGVEQMTHHLRGTRISVQLDVDPAPSAEFVFDGVAVEYEPVRESQEAA